LTRLSGELIDLRLDDDFAVCPDDGHFDDTIPVSGQAVGVSSGSVDQFTLMDWWDSGRFALYQAPDGSPLHAKSD